MELIRGLYNLRPHHKHCVATIGNFDGVHCGHQAVFRNLQQHAEKYQLPTCVISFEPLPNEYFNAERAPARLSSFREKVLAMRSQPVDRLLILPFNKHLATQSAETFIHNILLEHLAIRHLVVGDDFRFGADRRGDFELLQHQGEQHQFSVESTQTLRMAETRVSSTHIRELLADADFDRVETLLGRPYQIDGRVIVGQQLGRTLGFPTANLNIKRNKTPIKGVFAIEAVERDGSRHQGMANLGTRPTVDGIKTVLEVNLFNFSKTIYGEHLTIIFRHKIRDEKRFDSLDDLKAAINNDRCIATQFFTANPKN